jgi:hypothetical protein
MKEVSEFEAKLLRILRCLMHSTSADQSLSLFVQATPRPKCLSRQCIELVQDYLKKGVTEWLARSGWMTGRFLRHQAIVAGRLWERHPPESLRLTFSRNSMELLIWLTAENFSDPASPVAIDVESVTPGDELLMLMTFSALRSTLGAAILVKQPGFRNHGLIALLFPEVVAVLNGFGEPNISIWCQQDRAWILEALQSKLAHQWFSMENFKRSSSNYTDLKKIGEMQSSVHTRLCEAAESFGRQDLCVFLLMAARLLFQAVTVDRWYDRLDLRLLRMTERAPIFRAGLAFFLGLNRLEQWTQRAQSVGFYDEDYRASQLWKSEWERLGGDALCLRARRIIELVDPLRTAAAN